MRYSVTCVAGRSMLNFLLFQFLAGQVRKSAPLQGMLRSLFNK